LKENSKIIIEAKQCVLMPNHTDSQIKIDQKLQQSSHVFDEPDTYYVEVLLVQNCSRWSKMNMKMSVFINPTILKNVPMLAMKKMMKVLNHVKKPCHYVLLPSKR